MQGYYLLRARFADHGSFFVHPPGPKAKIHSRTAVEINEIESRNGVNSATGRGAVRARRLDFPRLAVQNFGISHWNSAVLSLMHVWPLVC
jgi:hypothetical protein